jgi:hypothetical protein
MMLDKKCEAERLAKVYKETNKECEEWRNSIQCQRDNKGKRTKWLSLKNIHVSGWENILIWNYYRQLHSYNVVTGSCMQEKNSNEWNERLRNCPSNLSIIQGWVILKREEMILSK